MIPVRELMIGNLVDTILHKQHCIITSVRRQTVRDGNHDSVIVNDEKENHLLPQHLNGIHLTPEILEICGFEKDTDYWVNEYFEIIEDGDGFVLRVAEYKEGRTFHYLHQLQNLFYALTGEELQVNLNKEITV